LKPERARREFCTPTHGGVSLRVRLTPKARTDRIEKVEDTAGGPALKARVRAVPEDGKANDALIALVADWLGVAKSRVTLETGATSRLKTLMIAGDGQAITASILAELAKGG
jgi:uncharacterized protein YggU (UPF0235/DUF167 family)